MKKYEFKVYTNTLTGTELQTWLNKAGDKGWHLDNIKEITGPFTVSKTQYIFQRETPGKAADTDEVAAPKSL